MWKAACDPDTLQRVPRTSLNLISFLAELPYSASDASDDAASTSAERSQCYLLDFATGLPAPYHDACLQYLRKNDIAKTGLDEFVKRLQDLYEKIEIMRDGAPVGGAPYVMELCLFRVRIRVMRTSLGISLYP